MTRRELAQVCVKRNIDILCVQETKWEDKMNGVGIIVSPKYKRSVIGVVRPSDRLIQVKLIISGVVYNIISTCAPRTGETVEMREKFMEGFE